MKQNNLETVGGRIRQVRIESAMNMKELARQVDVTATYLGIVERGERNPSPVLLQKIAQATGSSLEWLQTGQGDSTKALKDDARAQADAQGQNAGTPVPVDIDAPLFLALVIREVPDMTKERIAPTLGISREELDDVLSGESQEPAGQWSGYFSIWAKQMDIPAVCQKLRDIDLFLQYQYMENRRDNLYNSLKRLVGPGYPYFFPPTVHMKSRAVNNLFDDILYSERFVFQKGETPGPQDRHFLFHQFEGDIDDFSVDSIVDAGGQDSELVHIFTDERIIDAIREYYHKMEEQRDALLAKDEFPGGLSPISLLLADSDTWEIKGEVERLEDDDYDGGI